jgi:hypothetical protein
VKIASKVKNVTIRDYILDIFDSQSKMMGKIFQLLQ